jgi:predicted RNA polymerase sigma factor
VRKGDRVNAERSYRRAIAETAHPAERAYLERRLAELRG